jgi:hypothetical protein
MAISKIKSAGITADFANTLTAADLAPNSVDSSELIDGAVDLSHMSVNSIDSDQYVDASIDAAHIASNAVTEAKLADEGTLTQSAIKRSIHKAWILGR